MLRRLERQFQEVAWPPPSSFVDLGGMAALAVASSKSVPVLVLVLKERPKGTQDDFLCGCHKRNGMENQFNEFLVFVGRLELVPWWFPNLISHKTQPNRGRGTGLPSVLSP